MAKPDSIRFRKEAEQCKLAVKIAFFLESYVPPSYYDFALPDLLYFSNEQALLELRQNTIWRSLEREFLAAGGLVSEDWETEEAPSPRTERRIPINRRLDLILGTVAVAALIGASVGWCFPWLNSPIESQQTITSDK